MNKKRILKMKKNRMIFHFRIMNKYKHKLVKRYKFRMIIR